MAAPSTGDTGRLRGDARSAVESLVEKFRVDEPAIQAPAPSHSRPAAVGDRVSIGGLGLEGTVVMLHDHDAEIDVRGKRFRAHPAELRVVDAPSRPAPPPVRVNVHVAPREGSSSELLLVGHTVDQAIDRLKELRTALIAAAVTGKIDVRQEVT